MVLFCKEAYKEIQSILRSFNEIAVVKKDDVNLEWNREFVTLYNSNFKKMY